MMDNLERLEAALLFQNARALRSDAEAASPRQALTDEQFNPDQEEVVTNVFDSYTFLLLGSVKEAGSDY